MVALGARVRGAGCIYFAGGATALLHGWRTTTIDIDLKPDPEPAGLFEALAVLKNELDVNVELASPDDFIPAVPGWRERNLHIARHGPLDFYHYDLYGQALAKLQRGHARDLDDVRAMRPEGLIKLEPLQEFFTVIEPQLLRYPAIDPASFRAAVSGFATRPLTHTMPVNDLLTGLPGESLLREGLADVAAGRFTVAACLVAIAAPRLRRSRLLPAGAANLPAEAELKLYQLLRQAGGDAYSRYNALLRQLISSEQALDHRLRKNEILETEDNDGETAEGRT